MDGLAVRRIVHYVAYGTPGGEFPAGAYRAAIITQLDNVGLTEPFISSPEVSLCVLNPTGVFFNSEIPYDLDQKPGTWHWPERD